MGTDCSAGMHIIDPSPKLPLSRSQAAAQGFLFRHY